MRNLLCVAVVLMSSLFAGCTSSVFTPTASPNPWADDYSSLSSMENYQSWGTYNVHDPSCRKMGEYYYMYSTDAIFRENRKEAKEKGVPLGFIQMRRSKDLVNWEFLGWAFPEIPQEAVEWVRAHADGHGATNIWAPYIIPYNNKYRLYYCVSAFGRKTSYIGLAESDSPEGPWTLVGCVVKTDDMTAMNAIDPSITVDPSNGKWWMHYGSFFGGLYCVELNPETGLPLVEGDRGHLVASRANYKKDNLEAPEIIYNPELKEYFLFVSYDPLMTTYNVRVGRSDKAEGPFMDYFGKELKDTLWGEGELQDEEWNMSHLLHLEKDGKLGENKGTWDFTDAKQSLRLTLDGENIKDLIVFAGHDWENETETVLFTGLDSRGRSIWGKRIK